MSWSVAQAGKATIGGVKESSRQSLSNAKSSLKTTINNKESIADAFLQALEGTRKSAIEGTTSTISIKCKVAETPKSGDSNIYTVIYQEQKLQAISSSKEVTYNVGDTVLAIVPNGDFSDILNITGLYSAIEEEAITDEEYYEQVSPNLIKNQNEPYHLKTWVPSEQIYEISNTDAQLLWNSLFKENSKLCFSFDVLTQIDELYRGQGNYGVKIRLPIKSTSSEGEQAITEYGYQDIVVFDTNTMLGDPYEYDVKATQKFYIDINSEIQYVNYSELEEHPIQIVSFVDDNWTYPTDYETTKEWDVEFSNLQIFEVKPVPEEYQNGYYFILTAPDDGTLFVDNTGTIKLVPLLRYKMKEVVLNSDQYLCYWFKKNSSIKADSEKYLPIGGLGWEVLNGIFEDNGEYLNDTFEYTVNASDVFLEGQYKCVLIPTNNIPEGKTAETVETGYFEAEITLDKLNSGIEVSLTSNMDGIACNSTSIVYLDAVIRYEADTEPAINFNFARYNQDGNFIESSFGEIVSTTSHIIEEKPTTNVYEITQTYKFSAGIIPYNSFNTIICSFGVIDENSQIQDVGDASLIIKVGSSDKYILNIYGEAFYKYDTYGNAPTLDTYAGSGSRVVQIKPLSFVMINSNGKEFDLEEYIGWTFTWGIPKNSLIQIDVDVLSQRYDFDEDDNYYYFSSNQYSLNEISYEIENRFDKTKAANDTVTLELVNGTETLLSNVQITFTKDGLAGTNGSSYSAVVVARMTNPTTKEVSINNVPLGTWPLSSAEKGYEYGELVSNVHNLPAKLQAFYYNEKWYFFFPNWMSRFEGNDDPDVWINNNYLSIDKVVPTFDVKVMKEGKEIAEVVSAGGGSTTNGYTVEWSMLTNSDEKGMNRDSNVYVNFNINKDTGVLTVKDGSSAQWDSSSKVFFNIVQAKIKVANSGLVGDATNNKNYEYLFAYYPIEVTKIENKSAFPTGDTINLFPQLSGGFNEVIYRSDGLEPSYVDDENFTISNYNAVSKNQDLFDYAWTVSRNLYLTDEEETQASFNDNDTSRTDNVNEVTRVIKPISNFDNGITANYVKVNYGYDADKKEDLEDEKDQLENDNEILYKNIAYLIARRTSLFHKADDLGRHLCLYDTARNLAFDRRTKLLKKIAYYKEDLDNDVEDQNSIIGAARTIQNFLVNYFNQEDPNHHQYLYVGLLNECNGIHNIAETHYQRFEILNTDDTAIDELNELPFISNYSAFVNSDFTNGVSVDILQDYIKKCNELISSYNPDFVYFKNATNLKTIFMEIETNLTNIVDISSFVDDQNIPVTGHSDITVNLNTDYNPIESNKVGENVIDYFINKNLIKVLPGYIEVYDDNVVTFDDLRLKIMEPIAALREKVKNQIQVYAENIEIYQEEIDKNNVKINDLVEKLNYIDDNISTGITHVKPILFITNTADFGALHGWDGVSATTLVDDDIGECLYQPQIGAGEWDPETNSFKGLILGVKKFVDAQGNKHFMRGMFGYGPNQQGGSGSQQTLLLNSDTGQLILGDRLAARITVDPQFQRQKLNAENASDTETVGAIYSGNFFKNYKTDGSWMPINYGEDNEAHAGLLIDFTTPEIRFGNGNFELDTFGNLYAGGTGSIAAWKLSDHSLTSKNDTKSSPSNNQSLTLLSGKRAVYWLPSVENPQPITNISSLDTTKITYDSSAAKVDEYGQPMAVLIKTTLNEGGTLKRNRTVLRKVYLDDPNHVPAVYSNNHDTIDDNNNIGFYLSQEGLSILGKYQTQDFDAQGIETLSAVQNSRIEINTTDKPVIFSGSRTTFDTRSKGFYIGEDGISLYNNKYYVRNIVADGSYEIVTIDEVDYPVYLSNAGDRLICYYNEDQYLNRYEFRVIDDNNNITSTTKLPKTKSGGIYLSVNGLTMPSLYSKASDSLTSTSDGFYLSDCGISLGSKFKVTNEGVAYIGYSAVDRGGVENGKFWTINGNSNNSYISYNDNKLYNYKYTVVSDEEKAIPGISPSDEGWYKIVSGEYQKTTKVTDNHVVPGTTYYKRSFDFNTTSVYFGTDGIRLGKTFLVDKDNKFLYFGNLTSSTRYWTLNGDSGNAYLAYNCVGTRQNGTSVYSDLGSCVYEDEQKYYTNSSGSQYVTSIAYRINGAGDDSEADPSEYGDTDAASPDDKNATYDAKETVQIDDEREGANTDEEDPEVTTYRIENNKSVYFGTNGIRIGKHFGVNPQGQAVIKAGTIGNWTVNNNKIMSVLTPYNPQGTKKSNRKYLIELDAKDGLSCYQLNYKNESYYAVTPWAGVRPVDEGWYEKSGNNYILTSDTQAVAGKTYYEKGQIWKKKTQWYIKSNGRAYFRKLQIKKGEENYIELINGTVGNFTATSSGLSGGSISSATSIDGSSCSFSFSSLGSASSSSLNTTTLTVSGTSSFGGEISAYSGTRRCIDLVPNTSCGMSLTSLGCYIGPVLTDGSISTDYKVMTRAEVVTLINQALDGLSLTSTSATTTTKELMTGVSVENPNYTNYTNNEGNHRHGLDDPTVTPSKESITYVASALSAVRLNAPHIS